MTKVSVQPQWQNTQFLKSEEFKMLAMKMWKKCQMVIEHFFELLFNKRFSQRLASITPSHLLKKKKKKKKKKHLKRKPLQS